MGAGEPGGVPFSRLLDFDHFRPQIAQDHCAIGPGQIAGETKDFHTFQRSRHIFILLLVLF
jgi:hypothetical protein